jgi:HD-like signal output (HDOD) protein/CheY-like chemotaxis protein
VQKRVLFVDDEPAIRGIFEMLTPFIGEHTTIATAGSGREALKLISESHFDVVVTDLTMPEMSGVELLARVAEVSPSTARVVVSGDIDELTVSKCLLAAHRYFTKPFDPITLTKAIQSLGRAVDAAPRAELRELVGKLDGLPTPSETYLQLMKVLNSPDKSLEEIAQIVEADPSLATKVLQAVNSAMFGAGRSISSIFEAVQLIGLQVLRALVLTIHVFDFYQNARLKNEVKLLWAHSAEVARHARKICSDRRWPSEIVEQAFLSGLLHDVGRLILAATPEATRNSLFPLYKFYREGEAECAVSRVIEAEAAAYLLSLWGLPEVVISTVRDYAAGTRRPLESVEVPSPAVALALAHEIDSPEKAEKAERSTIRSILLISKNSVLATAIGIQCRRTDQFYMTAGTLREAFQTFHDLHFDIALVDPEIFPYPQDQIEGQLRQVNANTTVRVLSSSTAPASEYLDLFEGEVVEAA